LVTPADAGIEAGGRRHVRGLRREELALLAGISVDYYVRLEQGRDRNPSPEVVAALARALHLDADGTRHLHTLATNRPSPNGPSPNGQDSNKSSPNRPATDGAGCNERAADGTGSGGCGPEESRAGAAERLGRAAVRPGVERLVESTPWPAVLIDHALTVVRTNEAGRQLNPGHAEGRNLVRDAFLDPGLADFFVDLPGVRAQCAAALRSVVGEYGDDPRLQRLVGELSVKSEEFRRVWARADVDYCAEGSKRFRHPLVGSLTLDFESMNVGDTGLRLIVYTAAAGTPDGDKLALLTGFAPI
jgi:transcriptional regulator with XRE-family HTH domain